MSDVLVKALGFNNSVKIYSVTTTDALNLVGDRLNYLPSALDSLGRVMSMAAMMGGCLKLEETITLKVEGNGPIGRILVDADAHGHIKGYAENPHVHFENANQTLNSKATIGDQGMITVIKDLKLKEPFIGYTPIINGGIAEDFAYYYSVSEQIPTAISLGVLVDTESRAKVSGGFMIQLLPFASDEVISAIEEKLNNLPPMSELLDSGYSPEDIIKNIDPNASIIETVPVEYRCNCSKERFSRGILSLGSKEIKDMIDEDGKADTTCHFCGNTYHFDKEELEDLYEEALSKNK